MLLPKKISLLTDVIWVRTGIHLKGVLRNPKQNEFVDLWIIKHTDRDHIGVVEAFIKDPFINKKKNLELYYWFNWSSYEFIPLDVNKGLCRNLLLLKFIFSNTITSIHF